MACLAWRFAKFARLSLRDPVVGVRANFHALVSEKVQAKVTLNALLTCGVTFETAGIALGADPIHFEVVARAVIHTRPIIEERQKGFFPCVTFETLRGLSDWTFPAGPITVGAHYETLIVLIDQVVVLSQREDFERVCNLGNRPIYQTL